MTSVPCPWCDEAVALSPESWLRGEVRCDACSTSVELADPDTTPRTERPALALAA